MKSRRGDWVYLLLGLGLTVAYTSRSTSPSAWGWALGWPSLRAQAVPFSFGIGYRENIIQLALEFHDGRADDPLANRVAETLWALHTLVTGSVLTSFGVIAYRVPSDLLKSKKRPVVSKSAVIAWDNSRPFDERWGWQHDMDLTTRVSVAPLNSWTALHALPYALQSPVFEALHFYQESVRKFAFLGDDLTQVMHSDETPAGQADQSAVESAFLEAFKAIEALAGEPGDEARFRKRLIDLGIDPDETVGYTEKVPIIDRIRQIQRARDKRAGHGHRARSIPAITYRELMNAQAVAHTCLLRRLHHVGAFAAQDSLVRRSTDDNLDEE